jgi:hypothetical protein
MPQAFELYCKFKYGEIEYILYIQRSRRAVHLKSYLLCKQDYILWLIFLIINILGIEDAEI